MNRLTPALVLLALTSIGFAVSAQATFRTMTETEARLATTTAAQRAGGDNQRFVREAEKEVRHLFPDFRAAPHIVVSSDAIQVTVVGAVSNLIAQTSAHIRRLDPALPVPWIPHVAVNVEPRQMNAPDIVKIVVTRGFQPVAPVASALTQQDLRNRLGAVRRVHAGSVVFPREAFLPGARVVVTAVPESGPANFVLTLTDADLRTIQ